MEVWKFDEAMHWNSLLLELYHNEKWSQKSELVIILGG